MPNPYETANRQKKAFALLLTILEFKGSSETVATLDDHQWRILAGAAKVKEPSPTTKQEVIQMLIRWEHAEVAA